jgi:hypothetical protein
MAGARARAHARAEHRKTEPLDLQAAPRGREDRAVTRLRIVPVGNRSAAARSGGTLQINCTVRPVQEHKPQEHHAAEQPNVIYARPVWSAPRQPAGEHDLHDMQQSRARRERARFAEMPTAVIPAPGQSPSLADLQLRAAHALAGLQAGLQTLQSQGIDLRKWSKSSIAWTAALGVYAVVLFLIAILTS